MSGVTLKAHVDGRHVVLDEPHELVPDTKLIVLVPEWANGQDERDLWYQISISRLASAYANDEPEYTNEMIKERNPDHDPTATDAT